jgi:preprotein translocase subunit YajC
LAILIILALMLGVMYVVMIRPQRQRQAEQQSTIESADVGDEIITTGGIYGTITEVEGDDVDVELAPGIVVHMTRRAIAAVLPPEEEEEEDELDGSSSDDAGEPGEGDEGAVMDHEDAVRSGAADGVSEDGHR